MWIGTVLVFPILYVLAPILQYINHKTIALFIALVMNSIFWGTIIEIVRSKIIVKFRA